MRAALGLAASCLLAALPVRAKASADLAEKIETDLEAWDIEGARRGLDNLLHEDRTSALAAFLQGRVLFEQGEYDAAAKSFDEAVRRGAPAGEVDTHLRLARATAEEVKNDEVHESATSSCAPGRARTRCSFPMRSRAWRRRMRRSPRTSASRLPPRSASRCTRRRRRSRGCRR